MHRTLAILPMVLLQFTALSAQTGSPAHWFYKLDEQSTFQRGCFDPCLCPSLDQTPLRGSFRLEPAGSDWLFDYYDVTDVNWKAIVNGAMTRITGSGTYRIGGEFALEQSLDLDLAVGDEPVQRFSSGRVFGPAGFPRIQLTISVNGVFCFDTVMMVFAAPVPKISIDPADVRWETFLPPEGVSYDVVMGDLAGLRSAGGLGSSVLGCLADDTTATSLPFTADPPPGGGFWFLVREASAAGESTYDTGDEGQVGSRDAAMASSPAACP